MRHKKGGGLAENLLVFLPSWSLFVRPSEDRMQPYDTIFCQTREKSTSLHKDKQLSKQIGLHQSPRKLGRLILTFLAFNLNRAMVYCSSWSPNEHLVGRHLCWAPCSEGRLFWDNLCFKARRQFLKIHQFQTMYQIYNNLQNLSLWIHRGQIFFIVTGLIRRCAAIDSLMHQIPLPASKCSMWQQLTLQWSYHSVDTLLGNFEIKT